MEYQMAWLEYTKSSSDYRFFDNICIDEQIMDDSLINNAINELTRFSKEAIGRDIPVIRRTNGQADDNDNGTYNLYMELTVTGEVHPDGYQIIVGKHVRICAVNSKGFLLGVFRVIQLHRMKKLTVMQEETKNPSVPLRMLNHWDNMDGSIERGYSGKSFFFNGGKINTGERIRDYARLIASVGVNGVVINNVNVKNEATYLITTKYRERLCEIANIFESYGISLYLSVNFAAPMEFDLTTADPLDEQVAAWWAEAAKSLFVDIPNLGGFLVKADSEGRPGPFTYGRNHADGANMLADAVRPYNGTIIWRCFVYNCKQDWRDKKTDRARAGYDNFKHLDGKFADNVILQIKNGPMDFQVREPVSPLLGAMGNTNQIVEFQIAQEYTGQQIDLCYLIPMFKEILTFRTYCGKANDTIADVVSGKAFDNKRVGIAAVANTGDDPNWTGHDMAAANLYGFGRISYENEVSAETIAEEWIRLTYGNEKLVVNNVMQMLMTSREVYEKYTVPLGIGWMVNPSHHYGPNVDGYEYDRWGTYHRADHIGIGVDRSEKGTGYTTQYNLSNYEMYNSIETCPEELLLFFHYIPYTHILANGKTLIQHIYDTHFEGVEEVEEFIRLWAELEEYVTGKQYKNVSDRFCKQLQNAIEWRDTICTYFYRKSGIADKKQRTIW